jgi:hypothetical protein
LTKIPEKVRYFEIPEKVKDKRFILAHGFRGPSPWSDGSVARACDEAKYNSREGIGEQSCTPNDSQEAKRLGRAGGGGRH